MRRASQHGHHEQVAEEGPAFVGAYEIDIVAVGGEVQTTKSYVVRRKNLYVALARHIADPQAWLTAVSQRVNDVVTVRRNSRPQSLAAIRQFCDLHTLEIETRRALGPFVGGKSQNRQHPDHSPGGKDEN